MCTCILHFSLGYVPCFCDHTYIILGLPTRFSALQLWHVWMLVFLQAIHGHFGGTVDNICWLAPEVLAQDLSGYSFQSDMYSIGIAALELATGEAPFAGLPVTEVRV